MLRKTFEYRLEPDDAHRLLLENTLEVCRHLYNNALAYRRDAWKYEKKSLSYQTLARMLTQHKPLAEPIQSVHSQVLQQILMRLQKAFDNFFRRCKAKVRQKGYPR